MNKSYLSIVSDGSPGNTRVTVVNPDDGTEIEVEGIVELTIEMSPKHMATANVVVRPKAVSTEVRGRDTGWAFDCPVCSEHVDHECSPPDFVSATRDAAGAISRFGVAVSAVSSSFAAAPRRGLPPEPGVPMSAARPTPRPAFPKKDED